jgi:hypothetical protein
VVVVKRMEKRIARERHEGGVEEVYHARLWTGEMVKEKELSTKSPNGTETS